MAKNIVHDKNSFYIRQPQLKLWHMGIIGVLIAAAIMVSINSRSTVVQESVTIIVTLSIIGLLYILQNRGLDNRTASEFQSLVYSGAMRVNSLLTVIIYSDGSVFYMDPRYLTNFTQGSPHHNLDQFLTTMGVESANKIHIYDAIRDHERAEFEYVYKAGRKNAPLRIGVYPLERPEGFTVLTVSETTIEVTA